MKKKAKHPLEFIKPGVSLKTGGSMPCYNCGGSYQRGGSSHPQFSVYGSYYPYQENFTSFPDKIDHYRAQDKRVQVEGMVPLYKARGYQNAAMYPYMRGYAGLTEGQKRSVDQIMQNRYQGYTMTPWTTDQDIVGGLGIGYQASGRDPKNPKGLHLSNFSGELGASYENAYLAPYVKGATEVEFNFGRGQRLNQPFSIYGKGEFANRIRKRYDDYGTLQTDVNPNEMATGNLYLRGLLGARANFRDSGLSLFGEAGRNFSTGMPVYRAGLTKTFKKGGPIDTPYGQWQYPGEVTRIPSNRITMQGVNYPVLGVDNTGYKQMMLPGGEYRFPGSNVTEYPIMAQSGSAEPPDGMRKFYDQYLDSVFKKGSKDGKVSSWDVAMAFTGALIKNPYILFKKHSDLSQYDPKYSNADLGDPAINPYFEEELPKYSGNLNYYPTHYAVATERDQKRYQRYLERKEKREAEETAEAAEEAAQAIEDAKPEYKKPPSFRGKKIGRAIRNTIRGIGKGIENICRPGQPCYGLQYGGSPSSPLNVPQGYFLNPGQFRVHPTVFYPSYTPGQNAARGTAEPMVGMDDPIFNLVSLGSGWATKMPQTVQAAKLLKNETSPIVKSMGEIVGTAADVSNIDKGIKFSKAVGAKRYPKEIALGINEQAGATGLPKIFAERSGIFYDPKLFKSGSTDVPSFNAQLNDFRRAAMHGKVSPELNAMNKGQLSVSKGLAKDFMGSQRYPEVLRYPGSEAREIMPVDPMELFRRYYSPHKTGGSLSPSKAHQMLIDNSAHGKPLTDKQKRYFGYIYGSSKKELGGDWMPDSSPYKYSERMRINELNRMAYGGIGEHITVYPAVMDNGGISDPYFPNPQGQYTNQRLNNFLGLVKTSAQKAMVKQLEQSMYQPGMYSDMEQPIDTDYDMGYAMGGPTPYQNGFTAGTGWLAEYGGSHPYLPKAGRGFVNRAQAGTALINDPEDMTNQMDDNMIGSEEDMFDEKQKKRTQRKMERNARRAMNMFTGRSFFDYTPNTGPFPSYYDKVNRRDVKNLQPQNWNESTTASVDPSSVRYGMFNRKKPSWLGRNVSKYDINIDTDTQQRVARRMGSENPVSTPSINFEPEKNQTTGLTPSGPSMYSSTIPGSTIGKPGELGSSNYNPATDPANPAAPKINTEKVGVKRKTSNWWKNPDMWNAGMDAVTGLINRAEAEKQEAEARKKTSADYMFEPTVGNRGDYTPNYGYFRPDQMVPVQYQGAAGSYFPSSQYGGSPNDGVYMSDQEIQEILANGGEIEYLD